MSWETECLDTVFFMTDEGYNLPSRLSLLIILLANYCAAVGERINGETFFDKKILSLIIEPLQEL